MELGYMESYICEKFEINIWKFWKDLRTIMGLENTVFHQQVES